MKNEHTYGIAGLLRAPSEFFENIGDGPHAVGPILFLSALTVAGAALFGFALGSFVEATVGLLDALKMAGVVLFAFALTFPSLYVFASICGCRYSALRLATWGLVSTGLFGCLLAALAPILWIFAVSTETRAFIMVFSVLLASIAFGVAFKSVAQITDKGTTSRNAGVVIWTVLFAIVVLQTVTLLRPMLPSEGDAKDSGTKRFFIQHFLEEVCE